MCDTSCSFMRPCGGPFCPYDIKPTSASVRSDKETTASCAEQIHPEPMVPLRLVEEIDNQWKMFYLGAAHGGELRWEELEIAIRAAREGAR